MRELAAEILEHWDDGYWWADRQLLLAVLVAAATGLVTFTFKAAELLLEYALAGEVTPDG